MIFNDPVFKQEQIRNKILSNAQRKKQIVYGARAIQAQTGFFARPTEDYDIFTKSPKKEAYFLEKQLDRVVGRDYYYAKKGVNPGTWKVKGRGADGRKGTRDDEGVVDYTRTPKPTPKFKRINGVLYRKLSEEVKGKRQALADKKFAFRHEKDREDLQRIKIANSRVFKGHNFTTWFR